MRQVTKANSTRENRAKAAAWSRLSLKLVVWMILGPITDHISGAADGVDQFGREIPVDFAAQATEMCFDDRRLWLEVEIPHMFEQHGARHNFSSVLHQIHKK